MEDRVPSDRSTGRSLAELASSIATGRARAQESLAAQRARLQELEDELTRQADLVAGELQHDRQESDARAESLHEQAQSLERQQAQLLADQQEWERVQEEAGVQQQALAEFLQTKQDELDKRQCELEELESQLESVQRTLESSQRECDEQIEQMSQARKRVDEKLDALEKDREQIDSLAQETKIQRRRIARQFQEQRAEFQREMEQARDALRRQTLDEDEHSVALAAELAEVRTARDLAQSALADVQHHVVELESSLQATSGQSQAEQDAAQAALAALIAERDAALQRSDELQAELAAVQKSKGASGDGALQARCDELERKFALAAEEARELRRRHADLEEELAHRPPAGEAPSAAALSQIVAERDSLLEQLAQMEQRVKKAAAAGENGQKLQDLQRRFEMAVEDVRELKTEKAELEKQLRTARNAPAADTGANLDWEAQKRKLLASLENDFDEDDEDERQDRLTIEGTIHITDEVIAEKDREIQELERLLAEQSEKVGDVAVGAAAIANAFNHDELICAERERLTALQTEMQDKLRQAEIDLSMERAKLARERAAIEEQMQALKDKTQVLERERPGEPAENKTSKKSTGGNWLARLGLKDSGDRDS